MKTIKIKLTKIDRIKEILGVISQPEIPRKIVFNCMSNLPIMADSRVINKIKKAANEENKEIEFISSQKFIRDILKNSNFNIYSKCPSDYKDIEEKSIDELYKKSPLPAKNKKISRENVTQKNKKEAEKKKEETLEKSFTAHTIHNPGRKKTSRSLIFFILILIIFFLGGIILWITPKAVITVKPKLSPIPIIQNIIVSLPDAELEVVDEGLPNVSGVFIGTEVTGSENFTSSGRRYDIENSRGKLTIFNETDKPKFLLPSRLSTEDGLIFRFNEKITVPPKKGNNAGEKVVTVVADQFDEKGFPIGYRGNIIAGTELFFPALREEIREFYYAKTNKGPLVGGSTLTHYIVDEKDEEKSADFLQDVLKTKAIDDLKMENQNRSIREKKDYILLENPDLLVSNFSNFLFPKNLIGQERETFEVSGKLELSGIVFDQDVVEEIIKKKLNTVLDDRQQLIALDPKSIEYKVLDKENFAEKRYLKLSVKATGAKSLDFTVNNRDSIELIDNLKKQINGKNSSQARSILINIPEIEQVLDINISPFWSDQIPKIFNRIEFTIDKML